MINDFDKDWENGDEKNIFGFLSLCVGDMSQKYYFSSAKYWLIGGDKREDL